MEKAFEYFKDRAESLLKRWEKAEHFSDAKKIEMFLAEINDESTKELIRSSKDNGLSKSNES